MYDEPIEDAIRKKGNIPICVAYWDVETDSIRLTLFPDVDDEDALALLDTIGVTFDVNEKKKTER